MPAHIKQNMQYPVSERCGVKENQIQLSHMTLLMNTFYCDGDYSEQFELTKDEVSFYFCLSGEEKARFSGAAGNVHIQRDRCGMFMANRGIEGEARLPNRRPFQILSLRIPTEKLNQATGPGYELVPADCRRLGEGRTTGWFNRDISMPPSVRAAVDQMFDCPLDGGIRDLYLEGKSLEIMACVLDRIGCPPVNAVAFSASDIEHLEKAREHLLADLTRPPGLMELARFAGMHHTKLNQGFKFLYGKTVFAHLTQARLETARSLLESGDMNCTEAGLFVGYSTPSHFSRAFKAQYHDSPNAFRKKIVRISK